MLHIKEEYTENPNDNVEDLMDDFAKYLDKQDIAIDYVDYSSKTIYVKTIKDLKDARYEVQKLIKPQKEVKILSYSPRAKKMLEVAYQTATEHKRSKIKSENILYGITKMPNCLAMQVLSNLGTDVLEIQQGIKQELLGGMDL